jgi:hypothetical protein
MNGRNEPLSGVSKLLDLFKETLGSSNIVVKNRFDEAILLHNLAPLRQGEADSFGHYPSNSISQKILKILTDSNEPRCNVSNLTMCFNFVQINTPAMPNKLQ